MDNNLQDPIEINELTNPAVVAELLRYAPVAAPDYVQLLQDFQQGQKVETSELSSFVSDAHTYVIQFINNDGTFTDEPMLHLEDLLAQLGGQL